MFVREEKNCNPRWYSGLLESGDEGNSGYRKRSDVALQERSRPLDSNSSSEQGPAVPLPGRLMRQYVRYRTLPCPPRPSKVVANERTFCQPWATPVTFYQHNQLSLACPSFS